MRLHHTVPIRCYCHIVIVSQQRVGTMSEHISAASPMEIQHRCGLARTLLVPEQLLPSNNLDFIPFFFYRPSPKVILFNFCYLDHNQLTTY